ncbi:major facilitator superfamily domain-containing protein [Ilyonectria sp. MPI-CAGE-AT-0026]|nr:major facilitator superfamily domain-containing protein [Ilyonectria sp. MPI-CAGE-AT-0026]
MERRADPEHGCTISQPESEHSKSAWFTVAGSFLVYFVSFGYMNSFGYFQDYYIQNDLAEFSPPIISLIGSMQLGLMLLVGPVSGTLFDAYGIKWLYLVAATGSTVSCIGLSFAQPGRIWQYFLSQGVLFGLMVPFGTSVALPVVGQHFRQNRALAMGVVAGGSSVGGVCLPIMFSHLVPRIGFAWSLRVAALIMLVFYGVAGFISTEKLPARPLKPARQIVDFGGFRDIRYTTLALANVVGNFGLYVPFYYIEPYIAVNFDGSGASSYLLPIINGSSFFGRVIGGYTADRIGGLNLLYALTTVSGCLCLTMWLLASSIGIVVSFVCLYGFCSGIFISVMSPVTSCLSPDDKIGARLGAFSAWGAIGVFTGTPIAGSFLKNNKSSEYTNLIIYTGVCMTVSGGLMFVTRLLCDRNLRKKW